MPVAYGRVTPLIGLPPGEYNEIPSVALQRLGIHLISRTVTALVSEQLTQQKRRPYLTGANDHAWQVAI